MYPTVKSIPLPLVFSTELLQIPLPKFCLKIGNLRQIPCVKHPSFIFFTQFQKCQFLQYIYQSVGLKIMITVKFLARKSPPKFSPKFLFEKIPFIGYSTKTLQLDFIYLLKMKFFTMLIDIKCSLLKLICFKCRRTLPFLNAENTPFPFPCSLFVPSVFQNNFPLFFRGKTHDIIFFNLEKSTLGFLLYNEICNIFCF